MDSAGIFGQAWLVFVGLGVDVQPSHFVAEATRGFAVGPALSFTSQVSLPADTGFAVECSICSTNN